MPVLPWKQLLEVDPDRQYVVMASRLPLRHHWTIPAMMKASAAVMGQLAGCQGLVGYGLDAKLIRKTFFTLSVWDSRHALERFSRAEPHRGAVRAIRSKTGPSTFVTWAVSGADLPITWSEARSRISANPSTGRTVDTRGGP